MTMNKIDKKTYTSLQNKDYQWYCILCNIDLYPFSKINDTELRDITQGFSKDPNQNKTLSSINDFLENQNDIN